MHSTLQSVEPFTETVALSVEMGHTGSRAVDQKSTYIAIATLGDPKKRHFTARRMLSGHQSEPGRKIPRTPKLAAIADRSQQCCGGE
jgi:hypothetical protein